ncbi:electron transport complex subunit RsxB [Roseateles sp. BYS180W]|uniref:Electron transport complex subunit RsxB n=1 Tax=Roseateles rivi TaxID=3299028 RepID=A0ABW7FZ85_9BURK
MNSADLPTLIQQLDAALPQTQCTRCAYPDCHSYASAIALGEAAINQCPPGGDTGVARLAALVGGTPTALNPAHGTQAERGVAVIDETWCIGCTLCIKACPVDAIVGANKHMHTVLEPECTGCELCIPACPVDCISMVSVTPGRSGWDAWSPDLASQARQRYQERQLRLERETRQQQERLEAKAAYKLAHLAQESRITDPQQLDKKRAVIEAALARARAKRESSAS